MDNTLVVYIIMDAISQEKDILKKLCLGLMTDINKTADEFSKLCIDGIGGIVSKQVFHNLRIKHTAIL